MTKWYYVTIDYRSAKGPGTWLGSAKGESPEAALKDAIWELRQGKIDLRVDRTQIKLSGWQRGR